MQKLWCNTWRGAPLQLADKWYHFGYATVTISFFTSSSDVVIGSRNSASLNWIITHCYTTDINLLAIIGQGWVWYEELCRSSRLLSAEDQGLRRMAFFEVCIFSYHTKAQFNSCLIIYSKSIHARLWKLTIFKLLYSKYLKGDKFTLSVYVAVGKFVCDVNGGKPVRSCFVGVHNCQVTKSFLVRPWREPYF